MRRSLVFLSVTAGLCLMVTLVATAGNKVEPITEMLDDVSGSCPPGFSVKYTDAGVPPDQNANGIICLMYRFANGRTAIEKEASVKGKSVSKTQTLNSKSKSASPAQGRLVKVRDDVNGLCPPDYTPVTLAGHHPQDENKNRILCISK